MNSDIANMQQMQNAYSPGPYYPFADPYPFKVNRQEDFCPHGSSCPICSERLRIEKENLEIEKKNKLQKEADYKKRCENYMIKFRKGSVNNASSLT